MARPRANEPRVVMRVPVSFRQLVLTEAKAAGQEPTVFLEGKRVVSIAG